MEKKMVMNAGTLLPLLRTVYFCNLLKPQVVPALRCEHSLCFRTVPDAAPGDVGGGGGSRSELVITWEVSDQSYVLLL